MLFLGQFVVAAKDGHPAILTEGQRSRMEKDEHCLSNISDRGLQPGIFK